MADDDVEIVEGRTSKAATVLQYPLPHYNIAKRGDVVDKHYDKPRNRGDKFDVYI